MQSKSSKLVEFEQEITALKAAAEEEFENGQKSLEESKARIGELKRKLEAVEDNKESKEQKVKELELADVSDDQVSTKPDLSNNNKKQWKFCHFF